MHHLQELSRKRLLYLHLLTPEDVAVPIQKSFIITKNQYGNELESSSFVPLLPINNKTRPAVSQDLHDKSIEEVLMEKRRDRFKSKICKQKILYKEGCPTCGQDHISVQYFGQRHVCLRCREYIKTPDGQPVKLILDNEGNIIALTYDDRKQVRYVDFQKLVIFEKDCFASFAGPGELVVLLSDEGLIY
jgi:hypothetical protein